MREVQMSLAQTLSLQPVLIEQPHNFLQSSDRDNVGKDVDDGDSTG
jgi:hypothetical protein